MTDHSMSLDAIEDIKDDLNNLLEKYDDDENLHSDIQAAKEQMGFVEEQVEQKTTNDIPIERILKNLAAIQESTEVIHDHTHRHQSEMEFFGWPEPNPYELASNTEARLDGLRDDLRQKLDDSDDKQTDPIGATRFLRQIKRCEDYAEYQTDGHLTFVYPTDHHDYDFVVEFDDRILDSPATTSRTTGQKLAMETVEQELDVTVTGTLPRDDCIHIQFERSSHPIFQ